MRILKQEASPPVITANHLKITQVGVSISVCGKDILTRIAIEDVAGHGESVSRVSRQLYESLSKNMNKHYKFLSKRLQDPLAI